jgi:ribosomal protein L37AE/L43A
MRLALAAQQVMTLLEEHGSGIVGHLLDTDDNAGQRLREAVAESRAAGVILPESVAGEPKPVERDCPNCGSDRRVSASFTRGMTTFWQCVPCGQAYPKVASAPSPVVSSVPAGPVEVTEEAVDAVIKEWAGRRVHYVVASGMDDVLTTLRPLCREIAARVQAEAKAEERTRLASFITELVTGIIPAGTVTYEDALEMLGAELSANRERDARVRADERQRIAAEIRSACPASAQYMPRDTFNGMRDAYRHAAEIALEEPAAGSAVPVATPEQLTDGEFAKVFHHHEEGAEVEGRIRDCCEPVAGPVATPTEPTFDALLSDPAEQFDRHSLGLPPTTDVEALKRSIEEYRNAPPAAFTVAHTYCHNGLHSIPVGAECPSCGPEQQNIAAPAEQDGQR